MARQLTPPPDVAAWLADQRARGNLPAGFLPWWHRIHDAIAQMSESMSQNAAPEPSRATVGHAAREAAQMTGYSCRHLHRLAETGQIRSWQPGGPGTKRLIDVASVRDYQTGGGRDNHVPDMDIIGILACSDRGDYTMPPDLLDAYREHLTIPKGPTRDKAAAAIRAAANNHDWLIANHIQPSLDTLMAEVAEVVATLGPHAHTDTPPPDLLTAPAPVREAYLAFDPLTTRYRNIRNGWKALRTGGTTDPLGRDSPLAEIVDIDTHCPGWENAHAGRGYWPWGHGDRLKLAWATTHGVHLWTPTRQQHNDTWRARHQRLHGDAHKRNPESLYYH